MRDRGIAVLITASSQKEAKAIIAVLLRQKLIACGNIVPGIHSVFVWKARVEEAREVLLILKTKRRLFKKIVAAVKKVHSYDVPEIIAFPIVDGNEDYLKWIDNNVACKS